MATTDRFLTLANRELRNLQRREEDLAKRFEQMQRDRAAIRTRIAELTKTVTVYQEFIGASTDDESFNDEHIADTRPETPHVEPSLIVNTPPAHVNGEASMTTADIAAAYMAEHGGQAKIRDLLDELIRVGKLAGKEGDYGSVFGALKRNPKRFVKVAAGEFALVSETSE